MTAAALLELSTPSEIAEKPAHVTPQEEALILALRLEGKTYQQIADAVRRDRQTVTKVVQDYDDEASEVARKLLSGNAIRLAQNWLTASDIGAMKGRHEPSKDALLHARVIEPLQSDSASGVQVTVIIGMPGQPAGLDPVIIVKP